MKISNKIFLAAGGFIISFLLSLVIVHVEAAGNDSSVQIKKSSFSEKFTLIIKDPDGIQEFSLSLVGRYSYGGGLSSCPKSFSSDNVVLMDPSDFTPVMPAYVIDCKNNKTELEIPPPVDGVTESIRVKKEEPPPASPPSVPQKEEKKDGPLSREDIQYPVPSLGNCKNEIECRSYCDSVDHAKECFAFAKKYHLVSEEEAQKAADNFLNVTNGPGGCNSGKSCEAYCSTVDHIDECITFAEETGHYAPDELAEAKKFQALIKAGAEFPGGCKDRNTCEIYCGDPNHMEECLNFAEKSGFMPPEEIAEARKFMTLMRQGESPGGCTSKEQCENYCFEENHIDECIAFAEKAGVMSAEDAAMARKAGGKGPGNCRSKEQCDAYCRNNSEECFRFAEEHGLINEDDLNHMRKGMARFREELGKMPPEAVQCMKDAAGEENFNKMIAGEPVFDRSVEEKMKSCFGQVTAGFSQQLNQLPPEAAQCIKDAVGDEGLQKLQSGKFDEHLNFESLEDCFQQLKAPFGDGGNFGGGGFSGPGGCTSKEECTTYCTQNYQDPVCQQFMQPSAPNLPPQDYQQQYQQPTIGGSGSNFGDFNIPPEVSSCVGEEIMERVKRGEVSPDELRAKITACFQNLQSQPSSSQFPSIGSGQDYQQVQPTTNFSGPGGCTGPEECKTYCTQNYQDPACQQFMPPATSSSLIYSPIINILFGPLLLLFE